jgi:hypothetical protein
MTYPNKSKFIAIYKSMQSGHPSAHVGLKSLSTEDKALFDQFIFDAGALFIELKDELDQEIEGLGDDFSHEDPRFWTEDDWNTFHGRVEGHDYEEILTKYAKGENNLDLMWEEIGKRL